jgi:DNA-binding MarR family transcriptional regulator
LLYCSIAEQYNKKELLMPKDPFLKGTDTLRNLRVLEEIEKNPKVSQRDLAKKLGVALGIVNSLIHTLVRKGMIKIRGENNRTLTYHLTHRGVLHKSRLALEWTKNTISFYLQARKRIAAKLKALAEEGVKTVVFYGTNELAEIALIVASEVDLKVIGLIEGGETARKEILRFPVGSAEEMLGQKPDAVVICAEIDEKTLKTLSQLSPDNIKFYRLV